VLSEQGWPYASAASTGPDDPGRFRALFGRDALITSLQVLPARPDVARASLRALAARQGQHEDEITLEQPGKIGHEFRDHPPPSFVAGGWPAEQPFHYWATADATSWFLVVLDALADPELTAELRPAWQAAAGWLERSLVAGNGLIRHRPGSRAGLSQQGWRDASDTTVLTKGAGVLRPDGTRPAPPLADADTQAVTVAALRALARLTGDTRWSGRADRLRALLTERFLPDVVLLEAGDRPVIGAGSQLGWLLWADAVEPVAVAAVADRLCQPDITTGYGLRTLAATAPAFDWQGYHRGGSWPFDSWLGWAGLRAAGWTEAADRLRRGVLGALDELGDYPELYLIDLAGTLHPAPAGNRIQAWTVGAAWALQHGWDGRPGGSG